MGKRAGAGEEGRGRGVLGTSRGAFQRRGDKINHEEMFLTPSHWDPEPLFSAPAPGTCKGRGSTMAFLSGLVGECVQLMGRAPESLCENVRRVLLPKLLVLDVLFSQ